MSTEYFTEAKSGEAGSARDLDGQPRRERCASGSPGSTRASFGPSFLPGGKRIIFASNYGIRRGESSTCSRFAYRRLASGSRSPSRPASMDFRSYRQMENCWYSPPESDLDRLPGSHETDLFLADWDGNATPVYLPNAADQLRTDVDYLADPAREGRGVGTQSDWMPRAHVYRVGEYQRFWALHPHGRSGRWQEDDLRATLSRFRSQRKVEPQARSVIDGISDDISLTRSIQAGRVELERRSVAGSLVPSQDMGSAGGLISKWDDYASVERERTRRSLWCADFAPGVGSVPREHAAEQRPRRAGYYTPRLLQRARRAPKALIVVDEWPGARRWTRRPDLYL